MKQTEERRIRVKTFIGKYGWLFVLGISVMSGSALAQETIHFDSATKLFRIDAGQSTYAFGVNELGQLQSVYWGGRLAATDPLPAARNVSDWVPFETPADMNPQEYGGWGGGMYVEPALKVTFPDGNRDLDLRYISHTLAADGLTIVLKDISRDIFVTLHYTADAETGVLGRSASIQNKTSTSLRVMQAAAASLNLPSDEHYELTHLTGRWADEFNVQQQEIRPGKIVLDSRRGSTSAENSPWFAIERGGNSHDNDHGDTWFGALAWSGSWSISLDQDAIHRVHVVAGYNPFDFGYELAHGQTLETPVLYAGFTKEGLGGASRLLQRFETTHIRPHAPTPRLRPVLYNSWEATTYNVNEPVQVALAEKAASIGVERFVMDDGWFGQRKDEHAGLGDWYVNPKKFPHGLKPLIDKVHLLGMDFGLWVEPEMVNPDSDLYRQHPDWVLNFTGRPRTESKDQLVLNLARPEVRDYVLQFLDKLLSENDIAFLKWDYNRNWTEPGWPEVAPEQQQKIYVDYVWNLYGILRELRARHPRLEIEDCSAGGGRVDLGIMGLTDEFWTSDNTDPFDRLSIQDGYTHAYTPGTMMDWVTDSPSFVNHRVSSLDYRFLVAMQGSLGLGSDLTKWNAEDFGTAKQWIADYKQIRETVQQGSLYRLISPEHESEQSAMESVSIDKKQAVLFAYLHSSQKTMPYPTIQLRGLDAEKQYHLRGLHGAHADAPAVASGRYWMEHGFAPGLSGDFTAAAFILTAVSN